nr:hypothetical protein [Tanacetum cinerariifolium]GEZ22584.1 hypothetical protein [Tanacetum cinerariifolium]
SLSKDDDDDVENDDGQDDDNEQTESDNNGDDFEEKLDEKEDVNELYGDVNVNLERRDTKMTDTLLPNVKVTQVIEDTHVIMNVVTPEAQHQSSSVSSGFISNMLNPNPDTCIDFILNLNTETTSLVDVPVTMNVEMPPSSVITLPPPPVPLVQPQHQTRVLSPAFIPSTSLKNLPTFGSLFKFEDRVKSLEDDFLEFKQTNQFAEAISSIPGFVDKEEAQAKNKDFINKLDENIKKIIKEQVKVHVKEQVSKILPGIEKLVNEQLEAEVLTRSSNEAVTSYFCGNGAHVGYNCPTQVPSFQTLPSFPQQYSCCEDCGDLSEAYQIQTPQYIVNHPIFNAHNDLLDSQNKLMEQMTYMCEMVNQLIQKKQEEKQIQEDQAANARYWKIPAYYDDDDDYNFSITPNETVDSFIMGMSIFAGELTLLKLILPGIDETDYHPENEIRLSQRLLYDNSSPRPPKEFVSENSNADVESFSPFPICIEDSNYFMEEIDLTFTPDDPMPPSIEEDDDDSRDILIREEFLDNYSLPLLENESFHFDIPLSYRFPTKPPNGNTGILNIKMMGDVSDQKVPIPGLTITLVSNQEESPDLLSHRGFEKFQPSSECPMMIHGKNIPILDVLRFYFYPP